MKMKIYQEICVFFVSLSTPVLLYVMNNVPTFHEPLVILGTGLAVSGAMSLLAFLSVQRKQPKDILFYGLYFGNSNVLLNIQSTQHKNFRHGSDFNQNTQTYSLAVAYQVTILPVMESWKTMCVQFAFTSVLKLTNALEQDGFTSGFVGFYQRKGEPCMVTAYAIMMCYWEGVVHFLLYLLLLHHRAKANQYRGMGLFWAGSSFASTSVFIPGSVIGKYGSNIYPAFWLNVLLLLGSVWVAASLLSSLRELPVIPADEVESVQRKTLLTRPIDLLLVTSLLGVMVFTVFRGLVVLDCPLDSCFNYIYQYEPYLKDPVGYPRVMMLVYLFYGLPLMAAFVYGLVTPGCTWMLDWTVLFAGFMAQAQWCHISASLHPRTPYTYRIPEEMWQAVLLVNLAYVSAPLLLGLRCLWSPAFFMKTVPPGRVTKEKKSD